MLNRIKNKLAYYYFKLKGVKLGSGASVHLSLDVTNHKNLILRSQSILYKNISIYMNAIGSCTLGSNSHIAPYGYLLIGENKIVIGNDVAIGPHCTFICHSNSITGESKLFRENYLDGDIIIGDNVFIGAQCTLLPGTVIEDNVVVASNSVVKGRLESENVYGGSPVKIIKEID